MPSKNEIIGPYRLIEKLGSGAFGVVWKAEKYQAIAPPCAIKFPTGDEIDFDEVTDEARVWVRASGHANVLPIIEANVYDEQLLIVSEYAQSGSLHDWLKRHGGKAPTTQAAVEMTMGILAGLDHLHRQQIIHRDLKPANILLQGETPRLADFGLARVLKSSKGSATVAGTLAYMAPEAFKNKRTEQTDVWSAGVILYQMLTGSLPFDGEDLASMMGAIIHEPLPPLPNRIGGPLRAIVEKALEKDESRRYQSAAEMREALRASFGREEKREPETVRTVPPPDRPPDPELEAWKQVAATRDPRVVREFLRAYPDGRYAANARIKLKGLEPAPAAVKPAPKAREPWKRRSGVAMGSLLAIVMVVVGLSWYSSRPDTDAGNVPVTRTDSASTPLVEDLGNGVRMEMVRIPGGEFLMGSPSSEEGRSDDEGPQHRVSVKEFLMGKYEVTQRQWRAVAGMPKVAVDLNADPSNFKGDDLPVEQVSWDDAKEFIARLNRKQGLSEQTGYRLPSEAEWEYAARAGTTTPFAFGATISPEIVNYDGNYPYGGAGKGEYRAKTVPVGSLGKANDWGLFDMHGNVWEWCEDDWHGSYSGAPVDGRAWVDISRASDRVIRGGSWGSDAVYCRSANRNYISPGSRNGGLGFRLSRTLR